jgi:hypothetical protein
MPKVQPKIVGLALLGSRLDSLREKTVGKPRATLSWLELWAMTHIGTEVDEPGRMCIDWMPR